MFGNTLLLGTSQYLSLRIAYTAVWFLLSVSHVSHLEVVLDYGAIAETQEEFVPVGMHRVHLHAVVMCEQLHSCLSYRKQLQGNHNIIFDAVPLPYLKLRFVAFNV